ncbi:MAG: thioredoxin family protein [Microscillaceae bacterium]|nr:thioredoxin family protein [Microscillaceae bacterium]
MDTAINPQVITQELIDKALTYEAYRGLVDQLLTEGKTTGPNQSDDLTHYTQLNVQRMNRWDKTAQIDDALKAEIGKVQEKWIWLIITEGWCGDAAHNIPIIVKMAALNPNIELKFILRDENLEVMDAYLTDGGRSIPKLIALNAGTLEELGTWGPRPESIQELVKEYKKNPQESYSKFSEKVQLWYSKDKAQSIQREFNALIRTWNKV